MRKRVGMEFFFNENKKLPPQNRNQNKSKSIEEKSKPHLSIDDDGISFKSRFSGNSFNVFLPITSILGVYAKESGDGIFFSEDKKVPPSSKNINQSISKLKKPKSHLTIVK